MSEIRTLIIEDDAVVMPRLCDILRGIPEVELIHHAGTLDDALTAVRRLTPDLVFVDLETPDVDGFALIEAIGPSAMPPTVFVTAHRDRALRAFDLRAFDCLLKPFAHDRLLGALHRVRAQLRAAREHRVAETLLALAHDTAPAREPAPARFVVKSSGRVFFVPVAEIDWIESDGNYARLHAGGRTHVVRETMASLEQRLSSRRFARIHRSRIVNLERVRELRARGNGEYDVVLGDGTRFRIGRAYRQEVQDRLERG